MRISFDIDDTLVCDTSVPTEQFVPRWRRWWYPERLRRGTRDLMRELIRRRHQIWIYTTSDRSSRYLRGWFGSFGVPIHGVVNQAQHQRVVGRQGPSKYPPAFDIAFHVDDSEGVAEEGRRNRFHVLVVAPEDKDWTLRVLEALDGVARRIAESKGLPASSQGLRMAQRQDIHVARRSAIRWVSCMGVVCCSRQALARSGEAGPQKAQEVRLSHQPTRFHLIGQHDDKLSEHDCRGLIGSLLG